MLLCKLKLPHRMQFCLGFVGETDITMPHEHSKTAMTGPRATRQQAKHKETATPPKRLFLNYLAHAAAATRLPEARAFPHEPNARWGVTLPENWGRDYT
jgi:hypothetical protein